MANDLTFGDDLRAKLATGADKLADAVVATLGPGGKYVLIEHPYGGPESTKDGVTVAKSISLEDQTENLGAMLLKIAAVRTNDIAGDGTTTATLLAQQMYKAGLQAVSEGGRATYNPVFLTRGIERAVRIAVDALAGVTKEVKGGDQIHDVALISANYDEVIADVINLAINGGTVEPKHEGEAAKEYEGVGAKGVIAVKESRTHETTIDFVEGYEFERGFISPYLITDVERMVAEVTANIDDKVYVLVYDGKLGVQDLVRVLESAPDKEKRRFLLIAEDYTPETLYTLVMNKVNENIKAVAVKAPGFGDSRKQMLQDIAVSVGGQVISAETGVTIEKLAAEGLLVGTSTKPGYLGRADEVHVTGDSTTILNGAGTDADIEKRVKALEAARKKSDSDYEKEKLDERIGKLSGKAAVIYVGAYNETEMKARKDRVEDALNATRAAAAEGIVPGGGVAYLRLSEAIYAASKKEKNTSVKEGMLIVSRALETPVQRIAANAGASAEEVLAMLKAGESPSYGYDALNEKYGDMYELGILDPALVVRTAIENAASVAVNFLNTQCAVTLIPEKEEGHGQDMRGMM